MRLALQGRARPATFATARPFDRPGAPVRPVLQAPFVRLAVAAFALAAACATPVFADVVDVRGINFGIGGGSSQPVGASRSAYRTGLNGEAFLVADLGRSPLALRADFMYQNFALQGGSIPAAALPGGGTGTLLGITGDVLVHLANGRVRPFVMAGAGGFSVRTEYDADVDGTVETRFGAHAGAGVVVSFGALVIYAQGTYERISPLPKTPSSAVVQVVPLTIGVLF
jgi:hypothetical protein